MAYSRSSERLTREADQLQLGLEESEAEAVASLAPTVARVRDPAKPYRYPLLDYPPCEDVVHEQPCVCPDCGDAMRRLSEDVTEKLDYLPVSFRVVRHVRPRLSCCSCERIVQVPLPPVSVERGRLGAGLPAHVPALKYVSWLGERLESFLAFDGLPASHPGMVRVFGLHPPGLTPADAAYSAGISQPSAM